MLLMLKLRKRDKLLKRKLPRNLNLKQLLPKKRLLRNKLKMLATILRSK